MYEHNPLHPFKFPILIFNSNHTFSKISNSSTKKNHAPKNPLDEALHITWCRSGPRASSHDNQRRNEQHWLWAGCRGHAVAPAATKYRASSEKHQVDGGDAADTNILLRSAIDEIIEFQSDFGKNPEGDAFAELRTNKVYRRFVGTHDGQQSLQTALDKFDISKDPFQPFFFHRGDIVASFYTTDPFDNSDFYLFLSGRYFNAMGLRYAASHRGWFAVRVAPVSRFGDEAVAFARSIANACTITTFKQRLLDRRARELLFPSFFGQTENKQSELHKSLRPYPSSLTPLLFTLDACDSRFEYEGKVNTETLESFARYPFVHGGPSGSGKTVAALQLAEAMCAKRQDQLWYLKNDIDDETIMGVSDEQLSSFDPQHVIGCHIKVPEHVK